MATPRTPQEPAVVRACSDQGPHADNSTPPRISDRGKKSISSPSPVGNHPRVGGPNGSNKADDVHQADTSLEVENDAEGEEDAEAELFEAVDAAEEAAHALREKSNVASQAEVVETLDTYVMRGKEPCSGHDCCSITPTVSLCIRRFSYERRRKSLCRQRSRRRSLRALRTDRGRSIVSIRAQTCKGWLSGAFVADPPSRISARLSECQL